MKPQNIKNYIVLSVVVALAFFPLETYAAEVSHNFTEFIHLDGAVEAAKEPQTDLSPLDQLMKDFLGDIEKPNTFLAFDEEETDEEDELLGGGFWTDRKVLIGGGLLLTSGLLLGLLLALGGGNSSVAEIASGAPGTATPPPSSDESLAPQNLPSDPNNTEGDPNLPKDNNGDLPAGGGGGVPGNGHPLDTLSGIPNGNSGDPFFSVLPSEANGPNPGSSSNGSSIPHSPEPSTLLLSALGLFIPVLRRRFS